MNLSLLGYTALTVTGTTIRHLNNFILQHTNNGAETEPALDLMWRRRVAVHTCRYMTRKAIQSLETEMLANTETYVCQLTDVFLQTARRVERLHKNPSPPLMADDFDFEPGSKYKDTDATELRILGLHAAPLRMQEIIYSALDAISQTESLENFLDSYSMSLLWEICHLIKNEKYKTEVCHYWNGVNIPER
eukprot:Gregarina_sp_Poly_1__9416@NODE_58_length_17191_cov_34_446508_g49_i0_p9_GENE_NODE_58_length_17191_cov_34_446508_g49_i0NODE_58_length_17191_cov_34_446508_g49_i0_p9_ORF_typecomplete_len191_score29_46_NODE_58_length_17191_cov_34_446508_g49_i073327904